MLSLALPGTSWAHRLPAGVKFGALALAMAVLVAFDDPWPLAAAALIAVGLHATLGPRGLRAGAVAMRPIAWIIGLIVIWQLVTGTPREALVLALRIFSMVGLATFVTLTTPLPDLIALVERLAAPLARFGLSPRLPALAVAMVLRFIPVLRGRMEMLALAWRARSRKRPGPRLIVPMVLSLLDDSDHLAEALRARGGLTPPVRRN
ncbi:energy-coupling factor transporter transmembrane protein EcfT [Sinirhodobacter populi]|uniref:Energy-coupling factor transporter transmembrane protein EcfT n=1 Tax=Paenirhodobacter populi TaxID=2306993 RepID=A0A443KGG7_9RHOB|nr:energy-coupling factor transporter transmembrane protein EcfT [Sinirhodobacter populi]RWR31828.1 energy-coupling factor transporter transmembrane protein EcfT [Sinirhodobacter populi]